MVSGLVTVVLGTVVEVVSAMVVVVDCMPVVAVASLVASASLSSSPPVNPTKMINKNTVAGIITRFRFHHGLSAFALALSAFVDARASLWSLIPAP